MPFFLSLMFFSTKSENKRKEQILPRSGYGEEEEIK
jgi:hypothetical protein